MRKYRSVCEKLPVPTAETSIAKATGSENLLYVVH